MSKRNEKHFTGAEWYDNCYTYLMGSGRKYYKKCDYSCAGAPYPCRHYINSYWKILRYRRYRKKKPQFPTTLDAWKNRVKPFKFLAYENKRVEGYTSESKGRYSERC